jgi:anti-sigma factor RsiW
MTYVSEFAEHLAPQQLDAFVDGEILADDIEVVEQHLAGCHACTLRVLAATQLKTATTAAAQQRFVAPPESLARLSAQLRQQPQKKTARVYSVGSMRLGALAACILLSISLLSWRQLSQANTISAELLDQHLAVLSSGAVPEVLSSDRHTVKPWFQGKLPVSFNLPDVLPADTVLKGGDLTYLAGQPAAMLLFSIHKHQVSIFLTKGGGRVASIASRDNRSGFGIRSATTRELQITAVSDGNPSEVDALVVAIARAQSSH